MTKAKRLSADSALRTRLYRMGIDMIASAGWRTTTIEKIARQAKISLDRAAAIFPDPYALAQALADDIDRRTTDMLGAVDVTLPLRDRLFDALMTRFDVMQQDRAALLAIMEGAQSDRRLALQGVKSAHAAMRQILLRCGMPMKETKDRWLLFGLMALYARGLCVWRRDVSHDLSATMAALDRMMDRVERLFSLL